MFSVTVDLKLDVASETEAEALLEKLFKGNPQVADYDSYGAEEEQDEEDPEPEE